MPLLIVILAVALLILVIALRLNAFLALIITSIAAGILQGMPLEKIISSLSSGIGSTLGSLALILSFGAMLGKLIAESGAAQRISNNLIHSFGRKNIQWAIVLTGFIIGLPMFYTAGFVILIPLVFTIAASANLPVLYVGLPMAAALSVTHGFLPPHPGPTSIAILFKANINLTLLYGLIIAVPAIIVAGPLFSKLIKNINAVPLQKFYHPKKFTEDKMPSFGISLFTALVPVLLMTLGAIADLFFKDSSAGKILRGVGNPVISLLIAVLIAIFTLGLNRGKKMKEVMNSVSDSVADIGMIMLIIAGGGAFKQVLTDGGLTEYIAYALRDSPLSPLLLAWVMTAALRVMVGSATLAALTSAGILLPLVSSGNAELMVLAIGAGSLMFSHVNDIGFWIFKEYFNLSILQTLKSWSAMETIVSIMGLLGVLILSAFL
ncbi:MAG: gluconate:H+ symporter [Cytophagaceae bacterium]|nr:gluconate:H+ symporter [Cytophagaceae bacterium]